MNVRNVFKTVKGNPTIDGAGVHLIRVLGPSDVHDIDPFLMLDAFDSENPDDYIRGFPMHPHRGIETITYLIKGQINHKDSLGNGGTIQEGQSQWMTAGRGILHEEMPQVSDRLFGLQIWLNLPKTSKMAEPAYFDINQEMIDSVDLPNNEGIVKIISGSYNSVKGVHTRHIQANIFDISLKPGTEIEIPVSDENNLFIYIFEGEGYFGENEDMLVENRTVAIFDEGTSFKAKAGASGIRFMFFEAKPLKEPIAWGGPIVMNTDEELDEAFRELQMGSFIK
jgi:quercetin 2,3-dioxygenase